MRKRFLLGGLIVLAMLLAPLAAMAVTPDAVPAAKPGDAPAAKPAEAPAVKAAPAPEAAPVVKPAEVPPAKPAEAPAAKPAEVQAAKPAAAPEQSYIKFAGFGQLWYMYNDYGQKDANKVMRQYSDSNIFLKRARLQVKGDLLKNGFVSDEGAISYFMQLDFVGGPTAYAVNPTTATTTLALPLLLDFWINLKFWDFFQIRAGQMLIPFGYEPGRSPYDLELLNYSMLYGTGMKYAGTQLGFFPYLRDFGVYVHGEYKGFNYKLGIVNGQGLNQTDIILLGGNKWKDVLGRVGYNYGKMLSFGVSGYFGMEDSNVDIDKDRRKWRAGADIKFDYMGALILFEYIGGQTEKHNLAKEKADPTKLYFNPLAGQGLYLLGAYTFKTKAGDIQPAIRFDWWQDQTFAGTGPGTEYHGYYAYTVGANYIFFKRESQSAKLSAVYERMYATKNVYYVNAKGDNQPVMEDQFILQLGVSF